MDCFRFDRFQLDLPNRRLACDGAPIELNARYFDALALMVREAGQLISKDRFLEEVWRGVPVTDEALTQCVRTLRRQLGDDAARPRFIETVPKHGYRFIASVDHGADQTASVALAPAQWPNRWQLAFLVGSAGTLGGGVAGVIGGLFYGFLTAGQPGVGAASLLLVLMCVTTLIAGLGAAGVSFGIAVAAGRPGPWRIAGGAAGGLVVGAIVKLLGLDAFTLLLGRSPGDITGAAEGALLGAAVGLGAWLGTLGLRRGIAAAALAGGAAGGLIPLLGGRMMAGSLDLLAHQFPASRLRLDPLGALFGQAGFTPLAQIATGAIEGALFAGCIVGAMIVARRRLGD